MITDIFNAVKAAAIFDGVTFLMGPENVRQEMAPPRIIWVPTDDDFQPAQNAGNNPAPIRTRYAGTEIHVWGADYPTTEALVHALVANFHALVGSANYMVTKGAWKGQDGPTVTLGRGYVFAAGFKIPVTLPALLTAGPPLAVPLTPLMEPGDEPA